ncbi:MAG: glutamyl-tRNA reductase [Solirubrobacteraceae bacterium]|nr:glutamyl-tRNA reductase [Solirubrobacteraceae bacterium]
MTLLVLGISHMTAPLAQRERVALTERRARALLGVLAEHDAIEEVAALSTCNRTEVYLAVSRADDAAEAAAAALARVGGMRLRQLRAGIRRLDDAEAVRHVFRVAAGLESMVLGEAEIQGQIRRSHELALSAGTSGRELNRLFQDALHAGKRVRSETTISRHGASVASVAVELARRELGELGGRRALVIGAGEHGGLAARALSGAGVRTVFVASRARERAEDLARRFGGEAVGFPELAGQLALCDLVLTCTSCPQPVLTRRALAAATRGRRRLVVVDTAVPRDVEPSAGELDGVSLHDFDAIQREIARHRLAREDEALRAAPIIEEEVARFERWRSSLEVVPTISALRERGRAAAERALRKDEPRWRSLSDDERDRAERIARAVVSDLLHEPTLSLRRAGEQGASSRYVATVRELFGLGAP